MKRWMLVLALSGAAALAGCDQPQQEQIETTPPPVDLPPLPPAEAPTPPPTDGALPPPPAIDPSTLPEDQRQSAETVQPESETLFY